MKVKKLKLKLFFTKRKKKKRKRGAHTRVMNRKILCTSNKMMEGPKENCPSLKHES